MIVNLPHYLTYFHQVKARLVVSRHQQILIHMITLDINFGNDFGYTSAELIKPTPITTVYYIFVSLYSLFVCTLSIY